MDPIIHNLSLLDEPIYPQREIVIIGRNEHTSLLTTNLHIHHINRESKLSMSIDMEND
jgi:hypothetical protein